MKKVKIKVIKPFAYAYEGIQIVNYAPGKHEVSARCAEVAISEGWAKPISNKASKKANKGKKQ